MFETLITRIDGLDAILGGGIRYPADTAAFVFITGGPGTGKTLLALEMVARAWLEGEDGTTCLYYSVEQSPTNLAQKLATDFDWYGASERIAPRTARRSAAPSRAGGVWTAMKTTSACTGSGYSS